MPESCPPNGTTIPFFGTLPELLSLTNPPPDAHLRILAAPSDKFYNTSVPTVCGDNLIPVAEVAEWLARALPQATTAGQHLYYRPAMRGKNGKLIGSQILWADIDYKDTPNAAELIAKFPLTPTFVYFSGGGLHVIWILDVFTTDRRILQKKLYGICKALGADPQAALLDNGLRVPGSPNWKYITPGQPITKDKMVHPIQLNPHLHYAIENFPDGQKPSPPKTAETGPSTYREVFLEHFKDQVKDPSASQWLVCCPFHDDETPSFSINVDEGIYNCKATCCGIKGTAIDFYRRTKHITLQAAQQALSQLKAHSSLIKLFVQQLEAACVPVYQDGNDIVVMLRQPDGTLGQTLRISRGSTSSIQAALARLCNGSPVQQIQDVINDDLQAQTIQVILKEAALELGANLPTIDQIHMLGNGLHFTPDGILRVDHGRLSQWKINHWKRLPDALFKGRYMAHLTDSPNKTWYPRIKKDDKSPTSLGVVFQTMIHLLNPWYLSDEWDAIWTVAYTMYLNIWQAFDAAPIHWQVSGPSQSGKTCLSEGWFAGQLPESTAMALGCHYYTNASAAHIYQAHDGQKLPIVLDEIIDHDDFRTKALMELIRNMDGKGTPIHRGSKDSSTPRPTYDANFPTICAGIKTPALMQDQNRKFHQELKRKGNPNNPDDPPPRNPWQVINEQIDKEALIRLSVSACECCLQDLPAILSEFRRLQQVASNLEGSGYRMVFRLLPLLAIASQCGVNVDPMMKSLIIRVQKLEAQTIEASPLEIIRQALLYRPLRQPGFEGETTLAAEIARGTGADFRAPNEGIFYWRTEHVIALSVARFSMGKGSETHLDAQNIGRQLKNLPGYIGTAVRRIDGVNLRVHQFDAPAFLDGGHILPDQPCVKPLQIVSPSQN